MNNNNFKFSFWISRCIITHHKLIFYLLKQKFWFLVAVISKYVFFTLYFKSANKIIQAILIPAMVTSFVVYFKRISMKDGNYNIATQPCHFPAFKRLVVFITTKPQG